MGAEVEPSPVIAIGEMPELARMVDEAGADRTGWDIRRGDTGDLERAILGDAAAQTRAMIGECHGDPGARGD